MKQRRNIVQLLLLAELLVTSLLLSLLTALHQCQGQYSWEVCSGTMLHCPWLGGLTISGTGVLSSLPRQSRKK